MDHSHHGHSAKPESLKADQQDKQIYCGYSLHDRHFAKPGYRRCPDDSKHGYCGH